MEELAGWRTAAEKELEEANSKKVRAMPAASRLEPSRLSHCARSVAQRPWTQQEDDLVRTLVQTQMEGEGGNKWAEIAKHLPGRNGKQCRERCAAAATPTPVLSTPHPPLPPPLGRVVSHRACATPPLPCLARWHNQLDPAIKKGPFSAEEDATLIQKQASRASRVRAVAAPPPGLELPARCPARP